MSSPPELRVGVIGYGVMGKAHCYGYRVAPMLRRLPVRPVVSLISGRDAAAVAAAAAAYEVPEHTTDWRDIIGRGDIDMVDICTPPGTHAEIAIAAAAAGKAIVCEKPLAVTYQQAAAALSAVTAAGVPIGQGVGYGSSFANQVADLLDGWPDAPWTPGFAEGAAAQAVCAAIESSAAQDRWVAVSEVTGTQTPLAG